MDIFIPICVGLGTVFFLAFAGIGVLNYFMQLKPCKHEWEQRAKLYENDASRRPYAFLYRCIHCCKKKEV